MINIFLILLFTENSFNKKIQEGTSLGVVNCILAFKSYVEFKKQQRPIALIHGECTPVQGRYVMRKNPKLFRSSSFRHSSSEKNNLGTDFSKNSLEMVGKIIYITLFSQKKHPNFCYSPLAPS
jgi:hypothetical protein